MDSSDRQNMLYNILEDLKNYAHTLPQKYQLRLPYDALSSLAHVLMDETVFEIVNELVDLQRVAESHLHQQKTEMEKRHKSEHDNLLSKHKIEIQNAECQRRLHVLNHLPKLHTEQLEKMECDQERELKQFYSRALQILDEKVVEQQLTLQEVGIPAFKVTTNEIEVKVQMYILDFILKYSNSPVCCRIV